MATLTPAPSSLGIASSVIGPWFAPDVTLAAPNPDLSVTVTLNAGSAWLPPAAGLLGLYVATATRPRDIALLRDAAGQPAFATGAVVAVFRLLPEVEARLEALMSAVPAATGASAAVPPIATRPIVRTFALELPAPAGAFATLKNLLDPPASTPEEVGLGTGGTSNGPAAMRDLKRPGILLGQQEKLISATTGIGAAKLWTFDTRGRVIDPGAVAAWWAFLASGAPGTFVNLFDPSLTGADRRTATVAPRLTTHLVNAHEGPLRGFELARLTTTGAAGTPPVINRATGAAGALTVAFTPAPTFPTPDDMPFPAIAVLPAGPYGATVALWPAGAVGGITRDFVRVAVVGIEEHLVGQRRVPPPGPNADQTRRAADQERLSTRVLVGRTTAPALRATTDAAASAVTGVFGGGPTRFVTSVLSADWTGLTAPTLPSVAPPPTAPTITVRALVGGGTAAGNTIAAQRVLVEIAAGSVPTGAWVRAWPLGFDALVGRHVRLSGGAGLAAADGSVALVMTLPDGAVSSPAPMGLDLMVVTALRERLYSDLRFARPAPVTGAAPAVASVTDTIVECETARTFANGAAVTDVRSGTTLVARSSPPALVARGSIPMSALAATSVGRLLASGDVVRLTQPAFREEPEGDAPGSIAPIAGVTVTRVARSLLTRVSGGSTTVGGTPTSVPITVGPLPTMHALEIAAARVTATAVTAAVAATPTLSRWHELGPSQLANPGAPADVEIHGTGVALSGPAAVGVAEYVRDRTALNTPMLATLTATALPAPAAPAAPSPWAAALRTVGADSDGEPGVGSAAAATGAYAFGGTLASITAALALVGVTIPAGISGPVASIVRAVDRRVMSAGWGAREGAVSLAAAFERAEDFVYIETPAISPGAFGQGTDALGVWGTLAGRMTQRQALVVIVCVPVRTLPGTPEPLARVRDVQLLGAIAALPDHDRVAVFSPSAGPGRSGRLASTTVIVDDAYVVTGTTHLSRRGLSFDSSLAVSVFDETLTGGRPAEIVSFRRALLAGRLGLAPALLPDDPVDLLHALRRLIARGGVGRLATPGLMAPTIMPSATDIDIWDQDGSRNAPGINIVDWLGATIPGTYQAIESFTNPAP